MLGGPEFQVLCFSPISRCMGVSVKENCPYRGLPKQNFWRTAVAVDGYSELVPQGVGTPIIGAKTAVASAGSCFAQHIARELKRRGFSYIDTEPGPAWLDEESRASLGYGLYSARFGNIYTTAQLEQLIDRAYCHFEPDQLAWQDGSVWYDPFRPSAQPGGFASREEVLSDRNVHHAAVRQLFETLDVFVFTLGLTEAWRSRKDGAVFPACPGCDVGDFDPALFEFVNFSVSEVSGSLDRFLARLASVNSNAQVILTVSPIPLAATYTQRHVVEATTYSKSVLRVVAEEARVRHRNVHYFSSYEIVTGARRSDYLEEDQRNASPKAVSHVMRAFFSVFGDESAHALVGNKVTDEVSGKAVLCDEDKIAEALSRRAFGS
jgi:GSCFA family